MFKIARRIYEAFDRVTVEIRKINFKKLLFFGGIFFIIGIICWIAAGRISPIIYIYKFPSCAMPIPIMYALWAVFFFFVGAIFGGIYCGCEKFRRHKTYKCLFFIFLMQICVYLIHPLFFKATAPLLTFVVIVIAEMFCLFAIISCSQIYTLWTVLLSINLIWLVYNSYISLTFIIIN